MKKPGGSLKRRAVMAKIDHKKFADLVHRLYDVVAELEEMFPGRYFTPDGHMVGSLGEGLVADEFDLVLMLASNERFDARDSTGKRVEIEATQSSKVAFRSCPDFTIIVRINKDVTFETVYSGLGSIIWDKWKENRYRQADSIRPTSYRA
jgi:hypothetical protein